MTIPGVLRNYGMLLLPMGKRVETSVEAGSMTAGVSWWLSSRCLDALDLDLHIFWLREPEACSWIVTTEWFTGAVLGGKDGPDHGGHVGLSECFGGLVRPLDVHGGASVSGRGDDHGHGHALHQVVRYRDICRLYDGFGLMDAFIYQTLLNNK